jgi:hypothetical protein
MVEHGLRGNEKAKQIWRENVVQGWIYTDESVSDFLWKANRFLREHSVKGMSIFESVVETQSYVVFLKMSGLAAYLLFGYLEARKLDFTCSAGGAGGGRTLLRGFTSFESSMGHTFSLQKTDFSTQIAAHAVIEGLQCLVHLAHACWEVMGPFRTAQEFLQNDSTVELDSLVSLCLQEQDDVHNGAAESGDAVSYCCEPFFAWMVIDAVQLKLVSFADLSRCCAVSRPWRMSLLNDYFPMLSILSFDKQSEAKEADVLRALGRVKSPHLRLVDLKGCCKISASGMEDILRFVDSCGGVKEVDITACSAEAVLRAVAVGTQTVCGLDSPLELYKYLKVLTKPLLR